MSFTADNNKTFYILNKSGMLKMSDDGSTTIFMNFADTTPAIKKPVIVHWHDDKFYILDQLLGVVVFDGNGKYLQTIGEVGTGSGKFANPVNFWVGFDGSVVVLDFFPILSSGDEPTATELLVSMFDSKGKMIREFGPQTTDPFSGDFGLLMPWVGAMTRTKLFLVDISLKDFNISWSIKQFNLNGDFEKSWPIIEDEKLDKTELIRDLICSMDAG